MMTDEVKNIFIGIMFFIVLISGTSYIIDTILIDGLKVDKGFLGSVLGGTIGTLGVITTTYFLIEANKQATRDAAVLQDKQIRERDYTTFVLKQVEETMQLHHECNKLVNLDANLLRIVLEALEDIEVFREIHASDIENSEGETRITILDREAVFVDKYDKLKREELELRLEINEKLQRIAAKAILIPNVSEEISDIYTTLNTYYINIQDNYNEERTNKNKSVLPIINEFEKEYQERAKLLGDKLKELTLEIVKKYKKAP